MSRKTMWALATLVTIVAGCSWPGASTVTPQPTGSQAPNPNLPASMLASAAPAGQYAPSDGVMVWPVPTDAAASLKAAGLEALPTEGFTVHIHPHLDVYKDGKHVIVPGLIGIDPNGTFISALHTHVSSGVLHIESPSTITITLGQLFKEWNVPLEGAKAWVNGQPVPSAADVILTEPAHPNLSDHQELVVAFGTPPALLPSTYQAPGGADWF